jgi:uncharacterized protein (DUF1697 family)
MAMQAAFLRGVMATVVKNAELVRAFEAAGFTKVRTLLASGNVVFEARAASSGALEKRIEAAMQSELGRVFAPVVRSSEELEELVAADSFVEFDVPAGAKRVVSFFREKPKPMIALPATQGKATIHGLRGRHAFTSYLRVPGSPDFMVLIERAFGRSVTTRTWETVLKVARSLG